MPRVYDVSKPPFGWIIVGGGGVYWSLKLKTSRLFRKISLLFANFYYVLPIITMFLQSSLLFGSFILILTYFLPDVHKPWDYICGGLYLQVKLRPRNVGSYSGGLYSVAYIRNFMVWDRDRLVYGGDSYDSSDLLEVIARNYESEFITKDGES